MGKSGVFESDIDSDKAEFVFFALQFESFKNKFGREPLEGEDLFFDPSLDAPTDISEIRFSEIMNNWVDFCKRSN